MEASLSPSKQIMREKTRRRNGSAWKFSIKWKIIKKASLSSGLKNRLHPNSTASSTVRPQLSPIHVCQDKQVVLESLQRIITKKNTTPYPPNSLAKLLRITYSASDFVDRPGLPMTPTLSPKENMSTKWREMHGLNNWENLLDPLHPWVRREIVKYGEFSGATYEAFDFDPLSENCGNCRYDPCDLFDELGLSKHGYRVSKYIFALSHVDVPTWLERSQLLGATWSKDSNWMGYVAVSTDEESARIGRRDIVVAWRGTIAPSEWFSDLKANLKYVGHKEKKDVKVEEGFLSIYKSKSDSTRYNKLSASEQVMKEVTKLVNHYSTKSQGADDHQEISLTITGHSLGGALALLNAHEAAMSFPGLYVSVISFGAPMVGNLAFKHRLDQLGVKTLRVVVKQDIVPRLPGIISDKILRMFKFLSSKLNWMYMHVGVQLRLDTSLSPYLKQDFDLLGFHNVETYLHLVDGYLDTKSGFRMKARRDIALVNKSSDMLIEELRIPENWYQLPNKGLVLNSYGRWVKPVGRKLELLPSPSPFCEKSPTSHVPSAILISITN